jgi:hypothetical protein
MDDPLPGWRTQQDFKSFLELYFAARQASLPIVQHRLNPTSLDRRVCWPKTGGRILFQLCRTKWFRQGTF